MCVCRACSLISVILADFVSSLESNPAHTSKQQAATALFVILNVALLGVFGSRGTKPTVAAARQLCNTWSPAETRSPNELGNNLELLSGPLLEDEADARSVGQTRPSVRLGHLGTLL